MSQPDTLRGHLIARVDGRWVYQDTGTPTIGHPRACGFCGKSDTPEGHDGCIGFVPGVINACCGHGDTPTAYVVYDDGSELRGEEALRAMCAAVGFWAIAPTKGSE